MEPVIICQDCDCEQILGGCASCRETQRKAGKSPYGPRPVADNPFDADVQPAGECRPTAGAEDGDRSPIMRAVDAYDAARLAHHGQSPSLYGMSEANRRSIAPMIQAAIEAYHKAMPDDAAHLAEARADADETAKERDHAIETAKKLTIRLSAVSENLGLANAHIAELEAALRNLLARDERNTCQHEETYRGGYLWEICSQCGAKWADDEGGKPDWGDPPEWIAARAALAGSACGDAAGGEG